LQTTAQTAALQAAIKKTLTSAAFAKFVASAVQTTMAEAATPKPGDSITLSVPPVTSWTYFESCNSCAVFGHAVDHGHVLSLQTKYCPDDARDIGLWFGSETRLDDTGRAWFSSLPDHYVVDNFGNLVPLGRAQ
jgi:hypothetical protein